MSLHEALSQLSADWHESWSFPPSPESPRVIAEMSIHYDVYDREGFYATFDAKRRLLRSGFTYNLGRLFRSWQRWPDEAFFDYGIDWWADNVEWNRQNIHRHRKALKNCYRDHGFC